MSDIDTEYVGIIDKIGIKIVSQWRGSIAQKC
jgi:hypothetical protein